jgi:hypothetical protein
VRTHRIIAVLIAVIMIALAAAAQTAPPAQSKEQKPVDTAKLFAEIVGSYAYTYEAQDLVVSFWTENGKLYGAPQGQESEYAEVVLKDAEKLSFEATPPNGQLYEIEFLRGEDKKISKSVLRTGGIEIAGVRIK